MLDYFLAFQPMEVFVDDETKLTLHGLQQYYCKLKDSEKNRKLFDLLDVLEFNQVQLELVNRILTLDTYQDNPFSSVDLAPNMRLIYLTPLSILLEFISFVCFFQVVIFVKSVHRCVALSQLLVEQNFPAIAIHRGMAQEER